MPTVAAESGGGDSFEVSAVVKAVLGSTQNEVTLPSVLQGYAFTYAMSFASGEDEGEVIASLPEQPDEWMVTFAEAWLAATEKLMPGLVNKRASVWAGAEMPPPPKNIDPAEKHRLTWEDFPHDPARYQSKGLPAWVESMMTEGAVIDLVADMVSEDVQQYGWPNATALVEAIL